MSNLSPVIKSIQDIMRQDSGVDGDAQRISQLTWLLFLKVFDALEEELELTRDAYKSPIPESMRWRHWAADPEGMTGDDLQDFVNTELFVTLKNLPADPVRNPRGYVVRGVFEDAYNYMKSGQLLRQVINKLNAIDFNRQSERHQFNDLYEKILKDLQSAGNAGEFYTPRAVTQFMVDMVNPQLGETVLDPATGTGGFLVCSIEHLRKQVKTTEDETVLQQSIRGVEKKQLPHMLCVTNLMLHGIEVPSHIRHDNTLARPLREVTQADRVDVVLTNPPFGGIEEPGIEQGFPADVRTKETADLFLVLIKHILKVNGRAALVLPDGTLFGEGVKTRIKEQLLTECNLHTIVRLPNGVFAPYTGIKTNLLFFTKGQPTQHIWYYEHPYPAGVKSYNKTKPIRIEEFDAEKAWWGNEADGFAARVENERAWKVSIDQIQAANYNLDQKNPHAVDAVSHDPEVLLADYARLQTEAQGVEEPIESFTGERFDMSELKEMRGMDGESTEALTSVFDRGFEIAATSSGGITALRELVLAVALRGRLFDPKRPLVSNPDEQQVGAMSLLRKFSLPDGWKWRPVRELCTLRTGATPSTSNREYYGGPVKWLVSGDIHAREIFDCLGRITELAKSSTNCKLLPENSVLIALNGQGKTRATVAILRVPATCNQSLVAMTPLEDSVITAEFLFWNLRYRYREIRDITGQKQRRGLNMGLVGELCVAVPPIEEQGPIVTRIEELMRLCDALEAQGQLEAAQHAQLVQTLLGALTASATPDELADNWHRVATHFDLLLDRPEAVDALEQTILQLAVRGLLVPQDPNDEPASVLLQKIRAEKDWLIAEGKIKRDKPLAAIEKDEHPFELPTGWAWVRFDELIHPLKPIAYGVLVPGPEVSTGVPFVRIADLSLVDPPAKPEKTISPEVDAQFKRTRLEGGEILMGVVGSIGKLGIAPPTWCGANIARAICRIVPADAGLHGFVLFLLQTKFMQDSFRGDTRTLAQPTLNVGLIRAAFTPMPPPAEQSRIVARVESLRCLCADLRQRLAARQITQAHLAEALIDEVA